VRRGSRHGAAFAATRNPDYPLRATLGEEASPYGNEVEATVEKTSGDGEVRVALQSDGSTVVHARSSVGISRALSRDGDVMAGAVGEHCRTSVNRQAGEATSTARGRHDARAIALSDGRGAMASASVATAAGGRAKATGNNARVFSFSPGDAGKLPPYFRSWTTFQNSTLPPLSQEGWDQQLSQFGAALLGARQDTTTVTETPPPATAAAALPSSMAEDCSEHVNTSTLRSSERLSNVA
jgi:hypothetical protein